MAKSLKSVQSSGDVRAQISAMALRQSKAKSLSRNVGGIHGDSQGDWFPIVIREVGEHITQFLYPGCSLPMVTIATTPGAPRIDFAALATILAKQVWQENHSRFEDCRAYDSAVIALSNVLYDKQDRPKCEPVPLPVQEFSYKASDGCTS